MKISAIIKIMRRAGVKTVQVIQPIKYVPIKIVCYGCLKVIRIEQWPDPEFLFPSHGICPECLKKENEKQNQRRKK